MNKTTVNRVFVLRFLQGMNAVLGVTAFIIVSFFDAEMVNRVPDKLVPSWVAALAFALFVETSFVVISLAPDKLYRRRRNVATLLIVCQVLWCLSEVFQAQGAFSVTTVYTGIILFMGILSLVSLGIVKSIGRLHAVAEGVI